MRLSFVTFPDDLAMGLCELVGVLINCSDRIERVGLVLSCGLAMAFDGGVGFPYSL